MSFTKNGQNTSKKTARANKLSFEDDFFEIALHDGRRLRVPLCWYAPLASASAEQLHGYELWSGGEVLAWPELDEHLTVAGLMGPNPWRKNEHQSATQAAAQAQRP